MSTNASFSKFCELPPELRCKVFKYHLLQESVHTRGQCIHPLGPAGCRLLVPGRGGCLNCSINGGRPLQGLLTVSQDVYCEASPVMTLLNGLNFENIGQLKRFLGQCGPSRRPDVYQVKFVYQDRYATPAGLYTETFALLKQCVNLRKLQITVYSHHLCRGQTLMGLRKLLELRGITTLGVIFRDTAGIPRNRVAPRFYLPGPNTTLSQAARAELARAERNFVNQLQVVVKGRYSGAVLASRAATIPPPRTFTLPRIKNLARDAE